MSSTSRASLGASTGLPESVGVVLTKNLHESRAHRAFKSNTLGPGEPLGRSILLVVLKLVRMERRGGPESQYSRKKGWTVEQAKDIEIDTGASRCLSLGSDAWKRSLRIEIFHQ